MQAASRVVVTVVLSAVVGCGSDGGKNPLDIGVLLEVGPTAEGGPPAEVGPARDGTATDVASSREASPKPDTVAPPGRAGNWTGQYGSKKYGLSFVVDAAGAIRDFTITTDGGTCGSGVAYEVTFAGPATVQPDGSFSFKTSSACGSDKSCSTINPFQGKLTSDSAASGTFKHSYNKGVACFGSSATPVSWAAAKGCSLKPASGASATRFCP